MNASPEPQSGYAVDNLRPHDRAASEWSLRVRRGLTPAEEREFERWLAGDPKHAACFAELDATSRLLDQLRDPVLADSAPAPAAPDRETARWFSGRRSMVFASLAAAAAIVWAWPAWRRAALSHPSGAVFTQSAAANASQPRQISLRDGSTVHLSAASSLEILFTDLERRVRLTRGEAYFTVAKNPALPFFVEADTISLRAVGTAFNVRHQPQSVEVIVTEGRVRVEQSGRPVLPPAAASGAQALPERLLLAGEKAIIALSPANSPATNSASDSSRGTTAIVEDWQTRRLEFVDTPLLDVVAEFNRHNPHKLVIGDPDLAKRTFGGVFAPTGQQSFVEMLEQSFGIAAECKSGETILRSVR